jgi:hypothetical protein
MSWVEPAALLVSSRLLVGGFEDAYAPLCMLTWQGEAPQPDSLALSEFFASLVVPDAAEHGPWLQTVSVPEVGALRA